LETSIPIDMLATIGGLDDATSTREVPTCSEVTRIEVVRALRRVERATARQFSVHACVPVGEPIARRVREFGRRSGRHWRGISLADLVIAATVEHSVPRSRRRTYVASDVRGAAAAVHVVRARLRRPRWSLTTR
jgi:predicted nucleic acid-binding protein